MIITSTNNSIYQKKNDYETQNKSFQRSNFLKQKSSYDSVKFGEKANSKQSEAIMSNVAVAILSTVATVAVSIFAGFLGKKLYNNHKMQKELETARKEITQFVKAKDIKLDFLKDVKSIKSLENIKNLLKENKNQADCILKSIEEIYCHLNADKKSNFLNKTLEASEAYKYIKFLSEGSYEYISSIKSSLTSDKNEIPKLFEKIIEKKQDGSIHLKDSIKIKISDNQNLEILENDHIIDDNLSSIIIDRFIFDNLKGEYNLKKLADVDKSEIDKNVPINYADFINFVNENFVPILKDEKTAKKCFEALLQDYNPEYMLLNIFSNNQTVILFEQLSKKNHEELLKNKNFFTIFNNVFNIKPENLSENAKNLFKQTETALKEQRVEKQILKSIAEDSTLFNYMQINKNNPLYESVLKYLYENKENLSAQELVNSRVFATDLMTVYKDRNKLEAFETNFLDVLYLSLSEDKLSEIVNTPKALRYALKTFNMNIVDEKLYNGLVKKLTQIDTIEDKEHIIANFCLNASMVKNIDQDNLGNVFQKVLPQNKYAEMTNSPYTFEAYIQSKFNEPQNDVVKEFYKQFENELINTQTMSQEQLYLSIEYLKLIESKKIPKEKLTDFDKKLAQKVHACFEKQEQQQIID